MMAIGHRQCLFSTTVPQHTDNAATPLLLLNLDRKMVQNFVTIKKIVKFFPQNPTFSKFQY